jgi:ribose/xylose/arabinose/galactoside ABC-type transport system permease subunit
VFLIPPKYTFWELVLMYLLFGFVLFIGVFGIVVSAIGCNACVARAFGDAF